MSSGGGPRAKGSGRLDEGKFRQRVDDHYRVTASAKNQLRLAGRLTLAGALGLGTMAGIACTQEDSSSTAMAAACGVLGLVSGGTSRAATAAAQAPLSQADRSAATLKMWTRLLGLLLLLAGGGASISVNAGAEPPALPILVGGGVVWMLDFAAAMFSLRSAKALLNASDMQKRKASK